MNHIYRSIWNATLGCWVAAPETASTGGKASRSRTTCQPPVDGLWASASRFCLPQRAPVWMAVLALCGPASAADIELSTVGDSHDISATGSQTVDNFSGVAGTTLKLGGSTLTFGTVTSGTFAGEISGTGGLVKQGAGTQTLSGANTYSGGTTLNAGTLIVGNNAALGSGALTVAGAATLDSSSALTLANAINLGTGLTLGGSNALALSGVIDGTGGLTKNGGVNLTLSGANTYSGGTTLNAGTLTVGNNAALGTGALTVAGAATLDTSSALTLGNAINLGAGLTLSGSNALALSGVIGGTGGLTKTGSGTLTLSGANSYTGGTHVNAGMLTVNGSVAGNVAVASGATLAGTGSVGTATVSGATIAPGSASTPYGTLTVVGNLNMDSGSILRVAVDPSANQAGKLSVGGTAALNGTLQVDGQSLNFNGADRTYTVVSAQSVTGQFAHVAANFAFLSAAPDYADNTKVDLKLTRKTVTPSRPVTFADLAQTGNQRVVAQALEGMPTSSALHNFVLGLPNGAPPAVFAQLSGDSHAGVQGSLPSLSGHASRISQTRLHNNLTAGLRAGAPIAQSDGPLPASAWPTSKALPAWVEVVGHRQTLDGNSNAPGVKQNVYGLFLGADEEVGSSGWRVGGSLGYTNADAEIKSRDASADISSYSASVYTGKGFSHGINRINVMGGLAYTHHRIDSQRSVAGLGQNLKADYTANTLQLFGEVGYAMGQYSKQGIEPFAGINISQQRVGSFQESGGFAALRGQSSTDTTTSTTLGVRAHSDIKLAGKATRLKGTVGWRHAWGDVTQSTTMAFAGSSSFTVAGTPLARNTALLGLQAEVELSRRAALELGYQGEYGSGTRDHAVNVKMRWAY